MDLAAYACVLRRQFRIVAWVMGITLLLVAAALVRVSPDGIGWRSSPVYAGRSTLLVTQSGFPWGRSALADYVRANGNGVAVPRFADPGRMEYLAGLYSALAKSESVLRVIRKTGEVSPGSYDVVQLQGAGGRFLPLIQVVGKSTSRKQAVAITNGVAVGLQRYIVKNQDENRVPEATRVDIPVITAAETAEVLEGRKRTMAIMLFLLGSIATLVVAFGRDNVQRYRDLESSEDVLPPAVPEGGSVVELGTSRDAPAAAETGGERWGMTKP